MTDDLPARRPRSAKDHPTPRKRPDGYWHCHVTAGAGPDGKVIRRHVSAKTQAECQAKVDALIDAKKRGVPGTGLTKATVGEYLTEWIGGRRSTQHVRRTTITGYRYDLATAEPITRIRLNRLTTGNVEHLYGLMRDAGHVASIEHMSRTLDAALNDAVRDGLLLTNPAKGARRPKYEPDEIEPFSPDEAVRLLETAKGQRNGVRWTLGLALGMRRGEVLGLRWGDVTLDGEKPIVRVRKQLQRLEWEHGCKQAEPDHTATKCSKRYGGGLDLHDLKTSSSRRTIALPPSLAAELEVHKGRQDEERERAVLWVPTDAVVATTVGTWKEPRNDLRDFQKLCQAAGVPERSVHSMRHTAATLMLLSDVGLSDVGRVLGQSRPSMTERYAHWIADRQIVTANRIEGALWKKRSKAERGDDDAEG